MDVIDIERALITRYRTKILTPFIKAIKTFELLKPEDVVGVCISGGKDSFVMAKLFQELNRHSDFPFQIKFLVMDPGYSEGNIEKLKGNALKLGVPITIRKSNVFKVAQEKDKDHPCYLCARMRRGFLYKFAQSEGCNKIALAHHFNDVIETTILSVFYNGTFQTMVPKLKAKNYSDMELIRPMVFIREKDISNYLKYCDIQTMDCGCPVATKDLSSKRREIKEMIAEWKREHPQIDQNIFQSALNVNLDALIGWKFQDKEFSFLDFYDKSNEND